MTSERGTVTVTRPVPHVELLRAEGHAPGEVVDSILELRDVIIRESGRILIFDDLEMMTGYDSAVRVRLTEWSRLHKPKIGSFHILTRSRVAAMGVTVANLALGGHIRAHARREDFEAALDGELRRAPHLAASPH